MTIVVIKICLALCLVVAAVIDCRTRKIHNVTILIILVLVVGYHLVFSVFSWKEAIAVSIACTILFSLFFLSRIGGGDSKLLMALALFFNTGVWTEFIIAMGIAFWILFVPSYIAYRFWKKKFLYDLLLEGKTPLALPIAVGGIWTLYIM